MIHRRWMWLLVVFVIPFLVWGYDRLQTIGWVGGTDLEVEFAIVDASSGYPVPGARVQVQSEGGLYEECDKRAFELVADAGGVIHKVCRNSMCFGTQSGLRFTDTFVVHLPWWRYQAVAEGYEPSEWADLDVLEHSRRVQRLGPGNARLVVPVLLHKRAAAVGAGVGCHAFAALWR